MAVSQADNEIMSKQLGRQIRGALEVSYRTPTASRPW